MQLQDREGTSGGSIDRIIVAVPARDEQDHIADCIASVDAAAAATRLPTSIVVAADSCTDATAAAARAARVQHCRVSVVEGSWGAAGAARRAAVARVLGSGARRRQRTWIANTDGDTTVPESWLLAQLEVAGSHHAIAGIVELDPNRVPAGLLDRFRSSYLLQGEAHTHVHGANFGVRADWYVTAGGWCPRTSVGEDHGLWGRLVDAGATTLQSTKIRVLTSGRTVSRVEGGFASDLRVLTMADLRESGVGATGARP